jgi:predicted phage terminase large subunit-like protein
VDLYDELEADRIIAERNNGGDMVEATIRQVRRDVPVKTIVASRGKTVRAEPVAALYEQGRVHHCGVFPALEEQQTTFPVANELDDQLDAVVYGITELMNRRRRRVMDVDPVSGRIVWREQEPEVAAA